MMNDSNELFSNENNNNSNNNSNNGSNHDGGDGDDLFGDSTSDFSSMISSPQHDMNDLQSSPFTLTQMEQAINQESSPSSSSFSSSSPAAAQEQEQAQEQAQEQQETQSSSSPSPSSAATPSSSSTPTPTPYKKVVAVQEEEEDLFANSSNFAEEFGIHPMIGASDDGNHHHLMNGGFPVMMAEQQQQQQQQDQNPFMKELSTGNNNQQQQQQSFYQGGPPMNNNHFNNANVQQQNQPPTSHFPVMNNSNNNNMPPPPSVHKEIPVENGPPMFMNPQQQHQQHQQHQQQHQQAPPPSNPSQPSWQSPPPPQQQQPNHQPNYQQVQQQQQPPPQWNQPNPQQQWNQPPPQSSSQTQTQTNNNNNNSSMMRHSPFQPIVPTTMTPTNQSPPPNMMMTMMNHNNNNNNNNNQVPPQWNQAPPPQHQHQQQQQQQQRPPSSQSISPAPWQHQAPPPQQQSQQPPQQAWQRGGPSPHMNQNWQQQQAPPPQQQQQPWQSQHQHQPSSNSPHPWQNQHQQQAPHQQQQWNMYQQQQQQQPYNNNSHPYGYDQHQHQNHHWQQQQQQVHPGTQFFKPPPALPIFSFGFGKCAFMSAKSNQITVFNNGLSQVVPHHRSDVVASLDIDDRNSKQNYLDFTLNSILSTASREKWELWQIVQMMAKCNNNSGSDRDMLREQVVQFLLSFSNSNSSSSNGSSAESSSSSTSAPQVQVTYNESFVLPHLQAGNVRGAIDEAMHRGMYVIALLLAQNWPELNLQQQVMECITLNTCPTIGSMLGFNVQSKSNQDWRRTIALILKNQCQSTGVGVIQSIGDNFWKDQRNVYSAHLCYLLCGLLTPNGGSNDVLLNRVVLLGGDHKRNPKGFYDKETIERSMFIPEIYASPKFQPFKYVYALHLISQCGNYTLAQKYLNSIPKESYSPQFQYQLEVLNQRLKEATGKSSGGFFNRGGAGGGVTNWLFRGIENLIHGDESPSSPQQQQAAVQRQSQMLSQSPMMTMPPTVGNQSFAPVATPPVSTTPPSVSQSPKEDTSKSSNNSESKGWFGSLFGGSKSSKKGGINFGTDNQREYCNVRKRWVPKGMAGKVTPEELAQEQKAMAPPEMPKMDFLSTQSGPSINRRGGGLDLFNTGGNVANARPPSVTAPPPMAMTLPPTAGTPTMLAPPTGGFFVPPSSGTPPPSSFAPMKPAFVPNQSAMDAPSYEPPAANNLTMHPRSQSVPASFSNNEVPPPRYGTPNN